uniref:Uncharacterized protein n=1 Tax=Clastoptera arizonana TaxID=38151 RepID=A0A1B6E4S6_9HEMI
MYVFVLTLCLFNVAYGKNNSYWPRDIEYRTKVEMGLRYKLVEKVVEEIVPELQKNETTYEQKYDLLSRLVVVERPFLHFVQRIIEEKRYECLYAEKNVPKVLKMIAKLEKYKNAKIKKRLKKMLSVCYEFNYLHEAWDFEQLLDVNKLLNEEYFDELYKVDKEFHPPED